MGSPKPIKRTLKSRIYVVGSLLLRSLFVAGLAVAVSAAAAMAMMPENKAILDQLTKSPLHRQLAAGSGVVITIIVVMLLAQKAWKWLRSGSRNDVELQGHVQELIELIKLQQQKTVQQVGGMEKKLQRAENEAAVLSTRVKELLKSNQVFSSQVDNLEAELLLYQDTDVQKLAMSKRVGIVRNRLKDADPIITIAIEPKVRAVLRDRISSVPAAVAAVAEHLKESKAQVTAFANMPTFGSCLQDGLFNGYALSNNVDRYTNVVALVMVVLTDPQVRRDLRSRLVPDFTGAPGSLTDWEKLNTQLFKDLRWEQGRKTPADPGSDVLLSTMGKDRVGSLQKYERVAAALMAGLLMKDGLLA